MSDGQSEACEQHAAQEAHAAATVRCDACRWWDPHKRERCLADTPAFSICRRGPPQGGHQTPSWPVTREDDWCGAFGPV